MGMSVGKNAEAEMSIVSHAETPKIRRMKSDYFFQQLGGHYS